MHEIKREEKEKRKRQEGREERMNKSHMSQSQKSLYLFYTKPLNTVNIFPTIQPLEINSHLYSHLSLVNALPIN